MIDPKYTDLSLSDEHLITEYFSGKEAAFEILIQRYLNQAFNFAFKYMHTTAAAEDVTQEAFVKIWKNLKRFDASAIRKGVFNRVVV